MNDTKKALDFCHDLLRTIDLYGDVSMPKKTVEGCVNIARDGLEKLYNLFPDVFNVAATPTPQGEDEGKVKAEISFADIKMAIGTIQYNHLKMNVDKTAFDANPATHRIAEYVFKLLEEYKATPIGFQLCPKCNGQGKVSKPPYIAGDVNGWVDSGTGLYECNLCNGKMIIPLEATPVAVEDKLNITRKYIIQEAKDYEEGWGENDDAKSFQAGAEMILKLFNYPLDAITKTK